MLARKAIPLTDAKLLVLGLVAEMPRHAYELDSEIERRGMREWTQIGFSSVYFVLGELQRAGYVRAARPAGVKARKTFTLTARGRSALVARTLVALREPRATYSSVLLGMLHWSVLDRDDALEALNERGRALAAEIARLAHIQAEQQPLPDFVEAVFDFSIGQVRAEADWVVRTADYMRNKPWLK